MTHGDHPDPGIDIVRADHEGDRAGGVGDRARHERRRRRSVAATSTPADIETLLAAIPDGGAGGVGRRVDP